MAQSQVGITIIATDKASGVFKSHAEALKHARDGYESLGQYMKRTATEADATGKANQQVADATESAGQAADNASLSFSNLFSSFTLGNLAASAIQKGIQLVNQGFRDSVDIASNFERQMLGLNVAGQAFGHTGDEINAALKRVTADGLLGMGAAMTALRTLLADGLDMDTAITLLERFKDEAASGRIDTISFAQAVENLAQAWKMESSTLGDRCLVYDTLVMTENGPVQIGYLVENRLFPNVFSFDKMTGEIRPRQIANHFDNGMKRSMRITLASGRVIEGSFDHKLYRPDGTKVEFHELCTDDLVLSATSNPGSVSRAHSASDQSAQTRSAVSRVSNSTSSPQSKSPVASAATTSSIPVIETASQGSAQLIAGVNHGHSTTQEKTALNGEGDTNPEWTAQNVGKGSTNTEISGKKPFTVADSVPTEDTPSDSQALARPTTKAQTLQDTGESNLKPVAKGQDGAKLSSSETNIPARSAATQVESTSTLTTSSQQRSTKKSLSTSTTELPSANGATVSNMEHSEDTPKKTFSDSLDTSSKPFQTQPNGQQAIGSSQTTPSEKSKRLKRNSDEYQARETSVSTLEVSNVVSERKVPPLSSSSTGMDSNTHSRGLVVQFDRVVSVEHIGNRHTYNITVEGEHNYFLGDSYENLTLTANSGHQDNFSNALEIGAAALGKTVAKLTDVEREQAKLIGYMQQGAHTTGSAALMADTYAGSLARQAAEQEKASNILGQALIPALEYGSMSFTGFLATVTGASDGVQTLQSYLVTLAAVIRTVVHASFAPLQLLLGSLASLRDMSFQPLLASVDNVANGFIDTWSDAYGQFEKIYNDGAEGAAGAHGAALQNMTNANSAAQRKMQQQVEDATRQFQRSMEQRAKSFAESLRDMVIAHRDKALSLRADLAQEEADYAKSGKKRQEAYLSDIESLEERHADKLASIRELIDEEEKRGILDNGNFYSTANRDKVAKLEKSLQDEAAKHAKAMDKRKAQYAADVAEDQARHDAKMQQLQTQLDAELLVLNKHRADVAKVGDAQKEDDISRLKRTFAEQNAEAVRNHNEQLARVRQQGSDQGAAYGGAYTGAANSALSGMMSDHAKRMEQLRQASASGGADSAKSLWDSFKSGLSQWFSQLPQHLGNVLRSVDQHTGALSGLSALLKGIPATQALGNALQNLTGRATGGIVRPGEITLVGERGPEIAQFPPGTRIIPADQTRTMLSQQAPAGATINYTVGTQVIQTPTDFRAELQWLALRTR